MEGQGRRRVPKSLFVLGTCGILSFGALVMLVRMPRPHAEDLTELRDNGNDNVSDILSSSDSGPIYAALTAASNNGNSNLNKAKKSDSNKRQSEDGVCRSASCLKTARILLDSMNGSADPCNDFYSYACGGWKQKNAIPPSVSKWSPFGQLDFETNNLLQEILREPSMHGDPQPLVQAKEFFKACSDVAELNRVGLKPILQLLQNYGGWPILINPGQWNSSSFNWMRSVADLKRMFGTSSIVDIVVNQHLTNPIFSTVHLQQPTIFMSRPYLLNKANFPHYHKAYKTLIVDMVKELKSSPAASTYPEVNGPLNLKQVEKKAEEIIAFEEEIAKLTRDGVELQYGLRNFTATLTLHYLQSIFDNYTTPNTTNKVDLKKFMEYSFRTSGIKISDTQLISMSDTNYMGNIFELLSFTPKETLANYLHFRMMSWILSGTTSKMRQIIHKYQKVVYGISEPSPRDYVCASSAEEKFGVVLTQPYLSKTNVKKEAIQMAASIFEQIRTSFISLLDSAKWMNSTVKANFKKKARSISPCIGFASWMAPDGNEYDANTYQQHLKTHFKGLDIGKGGYLQKLWNVRVWLTDQKLRLLKDRFVPGCKWTSFVGQIGAFYDIRRQAVNIPVGLLQPPFFYDDIPMAVNYGGFGSILGHEFTHGFTGQGWTETDYGFSSISQCFIDQYSRFKVPEMNMLRINGVLTLDENYPDNGGVLEAYKAFKTFSPRGTQGQGQQSLPGLEKFSQDQLFFLGFANIWCSSSRYEGLVDQVLQDHHTPNRFRVIGTLQNSQEFANAFKCPAGSSMNPQKYKKCSAF